MKLKHLQYLVELKKYGTISKTAEKLFISQPSLSVAIKELETELGFDVIKRTKKGIIFTSRGEIVLEHCEKIMEEVEAISNLKGFLDHNLSGQLSVGCVPYIFNTIVLDTVFDIKTKFPQIHINLKEENSYDLTDLVFQRERDLGIIMVSNLEEAAFQKVFQKYHLKFLKLFDDEMHVWVGKNHPLYNNDKISMEEALQYPFISSRTFLNEYNQAVLENYNKKLEFVVIDTKEGFKKYLSKSHAVTIMPMCAIWEDPFYKKKLIKPLKIDGFKWNTKIGIIYAEDELLSTEESYFIDLLLEKCDGTNFCQH